LGEKLGDLQIRSVFVYEGNYYLSENRKMAVKQKSVILDAVSFIPTDYFLSHLIFFWSHSRSNPGHLALRQLLYLPVPPVSFLPSIPLFFTDSLSLRSKAGHANSRNMRGDEGTTSNHIGNRTSILDIVDVCRHETG
jgi:hypothetical protein